MEKVPERRFSLRRVMTDPWFAKKPDGSGVGENEDMSHLKKNKVVEVSSDDMMQSVHQVREMIESVRKRHHKNSNALRSKTNKYEMLPFSRW